MAGFQIGGIGSGLDVNSILSQLMALERQPLQKLQTRKTQYNAQVSAYGSLKSKLDSFKSSMDALKSADKFKVFTPTSTQTSALTASADGTASKGSYSIDVNQLATNDKWTTTSGYSTTATIGTGTLNFAIGVSGFSLVVDSSNNTLSQIRDAINNATDNIGITATIVTGDNDTARLTFTSNNTGASNQLSIGASGVPTGDLGDFLTSGGGNMTNVTVAKDAIIVVDSLTTVTRSSNKITDALGGVTLTLLEVTTSALTLDLARDDSAITSSVQSFASSFNSVRSTINNLRTGHLEADSTLLSIENMIIDELNTKANISGGDFNYLAEIGLTMDKNGKMQVDSSNVTKALDTDFEGFAALFSDDDQGFAYRLEALLRNMTQSDGLIDARTDGLGDTIDGIEDRIIAMERRLEDVEKRMRAQFGTMDRLVASLNNTSAYLNQI